MADFCNREEARACFNQVRVGIDGALSGISFSSAKTLISKIPCGRKNSKSGVRAGDVGIVDHDGRWLKIGCLYFSILLTRKPTFRYGLVNSG